MIKKSTAHKAEGLGNNENLSTFKSQRPQIESEEQFLDGLKSFMHAGRESRALGVSRIAHEWERVINFRILLVKQERKRCDVARAKRAALKLQVSAQSSLATTASPSSLQIRVGVSPSPE